MIPAYNNGSDTLTADFGSTAYIKISPSSAADFYSRTRKWYGELLMGEPGFEGSDATVLGNIVHYVAELAGSKNLRPLDDDVSAYLNTQQLENRAEIELIWKDMATTLLEGCIRGRALPVFTEHFLHYRLRDNIYVAGTCDALMPIGNGTYSVRDYKTAATKPAGIPFNYRLQAHIYAFLYVQLGYKISQIELQYVVRPTKTLPSRHFSFIEPFTDEDYLKVHNALHLMADSLALWNSAPELRYILAQDYTLRQAAPPTLFKD